MYKPPPPYDELFASNAKQKLAGLPMLQVWKGIRSSGPLPVISTEQRDTLIGLYDGGIRYVDDKLGEWIEVLRGAGVFDDAIFIYTSDHGEGLAQRNAPWGGHCLLYQEGLRVPLLIRFPGAGWAGRRVAQPVSHVDLLPTLLDYLGTYDPRLCGVSLLEDVDWKRPVLAQQKREAVLLGQWQLIGDYDGGNSVLFDLEQDPLEQAPITIQSESASERTIRAQLTKAASDLHASWFEPGAAKASATRSEKSRAELEKLGYGGKHEEEQR